MYIKIFCGMLLLLSKGTSFKLVIRIEFFQTFKIKPLIEPPIFYTLYLQGNKLLSRLIETT